MNHTAFIKLVKNMNLGLQLSYTESFNIVTADFVNSGIPILVSESIYWMPELAKTSTINYDEVIHKIIQAHNINKVLVKLSQRSLEAFNKQAKHIWNNYII